MTRSTKDPNACASFELEKFSDAEDKHLNKYLLCAKERRFKTALWELINSNYLEVGTAASTQMKAPVDKSRDMTKSDKEKKRKHNQDDNISNQGQALPDKAIEKDWKKKKVESSAPSDIGTSDNAVEDRKIEEFIFNDNEEEFVF